MKYFTIKELSHSDTAVARGIDNYPTAEVGRKRSRPASGKVRQAHPDKFRLSKRYSKPER